MSKYHIPLEAGRQYHLFNHAVGDELLFRTDDNFGYFLKKFALHTEAVCDTFSYTLMPNHFHFAVKIKSVEECAIHFEKIKKLQFDNSIHSLSDFLMERFSNLCNSYTKSYNKVFKRKGSLFIDYMKRSEIDNDAYFCNVINYIHFNAVHHGFCKNPLDWKWTSLHAFVAERKTKIKKEETFKIFGGYDKFRMTHSKMIKPLSEYEFI
jgi:REP element-mobilizing transposase RayT